MFLVLCSYQFVSSGFRLACDVDLACQNLLACGHQHPPEAVVPNLMNFLAPKAVTKCREIVDDFGKIRDKHCKAIDEYKKKLKEIKANKKAPAEKNGKKVKGSLDANQKRSIVKLEEKISEEQYQAGETKNNMYILILDMLYSFFIWLNVNVC